MSDSDTDNPGNESVFTPEAYIHVVDGRNRRT